MTVKVE